MGEERGLLSAPGYKGASPVACICARGCHLIERCACLFCCCRVLLSDWAFQKYGSSYMFLHFCVLHKQILSLLCICCIKWLVVCLCACVHIRCVFICVTARLTLRRLITLKDFQAQLSCGHLYSNSVPVRTPRYAEYN